jgi:hypothetical protein
MIQQFTRFSAAVSQSPELLEKANKLMADLGITTSIGHLAPDGATSIGPKQDDPHTPPPPPDAFKRPNDSTHAIGPKQDDPVVPPPPPELKRLPGIAKVKVGNTDLTKNGK